MTSDTKWDWIIPNTTITDMVYFSDPLTIKGAGFTAYYEISSAVVGTTYIFAVIGFTNGVYDGNILAAYFIDDWTEGLTRSIKIDFTSNRDYFRVALSAQGGAITISKGYIGYADTQRTINQINA